MVKNSYLVVDGVARMNGARVPSERIVELSDSEALYDLALGRLVEIGPGLNDQDQVALLGGAANLLSEITREARQIAQIAGAFS